MQLARECYCIGISLSPQREREYGTITFKPFKKTVIRASYENYDNRNRRPNTVTPRDFVSAWLGPTRGYPLQV